MERTAAGIYVAAIGRDTYRNDRSSERAEEFGAEFVSGAVGTIQKDAEAGKPGAGNDAAAEKIEIFSIERRIGDEGG